MSPDPFDDLDRALSTGLSALAPEVDGTGETLAAVRPRYERARRRARMVKVGGTVALLLAFGSVAALAAPRSNRGHVSVSSQTSAPPSTGRPAASSSTTVRPATTTSVPRGATSPTTTAHPSNHDVPSTVDTRPAIVPATGPSGPGGSSTTTVSSPPSTPASDVHLFDSQGGTVTVRFAHGALTLVHVTPASGYRPEVHDNRADRIEVRFGSDGGEWRIEVQIDHGRLTHAVTHH